jgi:hypothetical protein
MKTFKFLSYLTVAAMIVIVGCTEDELGPRIADESEFIAPVLNNPNTAPAQEFLPEDADEVYEVFNWERTNYGKVSISTLYTIQISTTEDFTEAQAVLTTSASELSVSVDDFNKAMLALGVPGFQEETVYVRVRSTVIGQDFAPLFSNVIERTVTTYQLSECGDYCSMGIIGSATPGGWDNDTDMRLSDPSKIDRHSWTVTLYLVNGAQVKIRAADSWDNNWGGSAFPSGTGVPGGADITVTDASGYYKVDFNDQTLAYTFTAVSGSYPTIGIIGTAVGGWDNDLDLTQDPNDPHVWTGTFTMTAGAAKFRANNGWDNNWGANTYPSGFGTPGGSDITVPTGGTYFVYFNDASGEYMFGPSNRGVPFTDIGIIGTSAGGWDNDVNLIRNPAVPYKWSKAFALTAGVAKFRADNSWDVNWGAGTFPGGVGTQSGSDIPVPDGYYVVSFNTLTGEYYFLK